MRPLLAAIAALCPLSVIAQPAFHADDIVGLGLASGPRSAGATERATQVVPVLDIERARWLLRSTQGVPEAGALWSPVAGLKIGVVATLEKGRSSSEVPAFSANAVPDLEAGAALGPIAEASLAFGPVPVRLTGRLRHGLQREQGVHVDARIAVGVVDRGAFRLNASLWATWDDADARTRAFGVTPSIAAVTGLQPVTYRAGLRDTGVGLAARWDLGGPWSAVGAVERRRLAGALRDGPVVQSAAQTAVVIGLAWRLP